MMTDEQIHEAAAELLRLVRSEQTAILYGSTDDEHRFNRAISEIRRHDQIERAIKRAVAKFPSVVCD